MTTMALGLFSLLCLCGSFYGLSFKKVIPSLCGSFCTLILTYLTAREWRTMLIDSGKDTAFLGFSRYPVVPIVLCALTAAALVIMIACTMQAKCKRSN